MKRLLKIAATAFAGACVLLPALPASAHATLESSTPAPSATLEDSPRDIILDFSDPVTPIEKSVELFDERRTAVEIPDATSPVADRIEVRDLPRLDPGLYLVVWRALSEDGHVAQGAFTFQIGTGSTAVSAEDLIAGFTGDRFSPLGLDWARHSSRTLTYLGLAAALGTLAFCAAIGRRRVPGIVVVGWVAALIGSVGQYATQTVYTSGSGWSRMFDSGLWSDVADTRLGTGIIVRVVLLILLLGLVVVVRRDRPLETDVDADSEIVKTRIAMTRIAMTQIAMTWWRSSTALIGAGIVATFAATGHPSASTPAALAAAVDAVHLAAVLLWLGGLIAILTGERTVDAARAFSRLATVALPIAVVTGIWQTWHLLGRFDDVTATDWGRSLVVKSSIVVGVMSIAMLARWIVISDRIASLRRLVTVEVCAAVVIIAATSVMVSSPPRVETGPEAVTVALAQDDIIANVTVTPGAVGPNEIHVAITTPGGTLEPVTNLRIRLTESGSDIPPVAADVETLGPNHFLGRVAILGSGTWDLELLVQVTPARIVRLSTTFDV